MARRIITLIFGAVASACANISREAVVEVAQEAIFAATYADDGAAVDADLNDRYDTVDDFFLRFWKSPSLAVQIDAEFDPIVGYPVRLCID
ncbi:MAG: DUF6174 domain-containing protein [Candidatus Latescibacterota bacterium]|nr:DUF6174 domain-containing protein [Candidatus Latescibacterota bacterium]